ncbi:MAG: histidine phosphatase family protein [Deltaproteobacteria bacterium]|nr:histidine phosphatase family protein [Deltaproteobacteria bacterium]
MLIHLFRHGIAIDRADPKCPEEAERFLTDKGVRRTKLAARGLARLGVRADLILTSPFVRARQSAELAKKALKLKKTKIRDTKALLWDSDPAALRKKLAALETVEEVLCAGHAPHLDLFIAHMVGTPMPVTELKKAGFATLYTDFTDPGDAVILQLYPPRALRELGDSW